MIETFFNSKKSIIVIFLLMLIGDTLTFFWVKENYNFSWFSKLIISVLLLINLYKSNFLLFKAILISGLLISLGAIGHKVNPIHKTSLFFEYYSGSLFFSFLIVNNRIYLLKKIVTCIFLFYVGIILIGAGFDISFLKTYYGSSRFGYMPFFSSQNEFSFVMIAIVIFFYKSFSTSKNTTSLLIFILALFASLCVGTKVVYLFNALFVLYIIYRSFGLRRLILLLTSLAIILYLTKKQWYQFLESHFSSFTTLYEKTNFFNALSSLRLEHLEGRLECQINNFRWHNYLFGGSIKECLIEMSLFDITLFFGFFGTIIYFFILKKAIVNHLKFDSDLLFFLATITLLSFVAGYYFENFTCQIFLMSVCYIYYFKLNSKIRFQNKESIE